MPSQPEEPAATATPAVPAGYQVRAYSGTAHLFALDRSRAADGKHQAACGTRVAARNGHTSRARLGCQRCLRLLATL